MTSDEAVDFMVAPCDMKVGGPAGLKHALGGMVGQVRRGESGGGELLKFLKASALKRRYTWRGGLLARVTGTRDGRPAVAVRRTPLSGLETCLVASMATLTGTACAAFMVMALDEAGKRAGSFAPRGLGRAGGLLHRTGARGHAAPRDRRVAALGPSSRRCTRHVHPSSGESPRPPRSG